MDEHLNNAFQTTEKVMSLVAPQKLYLERGAKIFIIFSTDHPCMS